jgi:queuine tRNA-ribosyltransferase
MALDVCAGYGASDAEQCEAMRLTHRWLPRNVAAFAETQLREPVGRLLFGICQGGFDTQRRAESAATVAGSPVAGCAIGGLSVGEPKIVMAEMLAASLAHLPADRPRYLMGVGSPEDLWNGVAAGVDMFDCVLPTRVARRGAVYTANGRVSIKAARYRDRDEPIDADCDCIACRAYSAAYLHHLFRVGELLAYRLASIHNLRFIARQMEAMRRAIQRGTFSSARNAFLADYRVADEQVASEQRARHLAARSTA